MLNPLGMIKAKAKKSLERDRAMERRMNVLSRFLWPWDDAWLVPLVVLLAASDLISTYILLEVSGKANVYESGLLANWALSRDGFNGLYIMNAVAVGLLCVIAVAAVAPGDQEDFEAELLEFINFDFPEEQRGAIERTIQRWQRTVTDSHRNDAGHILGSLGQLD